MLSHFKKALKIFGKGFFSSKYFLLNILIYFITVIGFFLLFSNNQQLSIALFVFSFVLFASVIYFDWRFNYIDMQNVYLFHSMFYSNWAIAVMDENNKVLQINDLFQMICEEKDIKHFDDILKYFEEYNLLYNALQEGMQCLDKENSFAKDINFGNKIWRLAMSHQISKIGTIRCLFIIDITSDIKINDLDKTLANMMNYVDDGIIVTNKFGNIVFYNIAAANMIKTSLVGKNIKSIVGFESLQANTPNKVKIDKNHFTVHVTYFGEENLMHKIKSINNTIDDNLMDSPFGFLQISQDLQIISLNKFWYKYFSSNFKLNQVVFQSDSFIEYINHFKKTKNTVPINFNLIKENGPLVSVILQNSKNGNINIFFIEDINSRDIKAQFLHEQRIYSLGEIVGSVSHDFNNIITTILGNCDVILERNSFPPTNEDYIDLMRIKQSAGRAADLIKQILNISRKQSLKEENLSINDLLFEFVATIGRVLGDKFDIKMIKKRNNLQVFMNEVSFEQIIINLILNARDAMPYGGLIQISTDVTNIDKSVFYNGSFVAKGDYVEIAVADSGIGISPDNIKKIFDPFFTTKKEKGNGFGLSTVNSLVKQKGGFIKLNSKIGVGTTFFIYLPISEATEQKTIVFQESTKSLNILFVEDEVNILFPTVKGLKTKGFEVEGSTDADEAIKKAKSIKKIDILISDISLPKVSGIELYLEIKKIHKNIQVIFTSGYSSEKISILDEPNIFFLQKPYSLSDLMSYIAKCSERVKN